MCKRQRDIEVEQQRQWRASKKERDSIKMMHNAMNLQLPHSPISPSPPEVEIPSVDARIQSYMDAGYFEQYGHIFYPDIGATSSTLHLEKESLVHTYSMEQQDPQDQPHFFLLQIMALALLELQELPQ